MTLMLQRGGRRCGGGSAHPGEKKLREKEKTWLFGFFRKLKNGEVASEQSKLPSLSRATWKYLPIFRKCLSEKGMKSTERVKRGNVICGNWIDLRCDVLNGRCPPPPPPSSKESGFSAKERIRVNYSHLAARSKSKGRRRGGGWRLELPGALILATVLNQWITVPGVPLKKPVAANHVSLVGALLHSRVRRCAARFLMHTHSKKKKKNTEIGASMWNKRYRETEEGTEKKETAACAGFSNCQKCAE